LIPHAQVNTNWFKRGRQLLQAIASGQICFKQFHEIALIQEKLAIASRSLLRILHFFQPWQIIGQRQHAPHMMRMGSCLA
jgi:hypothetical protein